MRLSEFHPSTGTQEMKAPRVLFPNSTLSMAGPLSPLEAWYSSLLQPAASSVGRRRAGVAREFTEAFSLHSSKPPVPPRVCNNRACSVLPSFLFPGRVSEGVFGSRSWGRMRIRKGPRCCVPVAPGAADRSFLLEGFAAGEDNNARREDDEKQRNGGVQHHVVVEARGGGGAAASVAATSGGHDCLDHRAASSSSGTMERLEVDRVQRKRLSADGYSRKRRTRGPIAEGPGVISISSIIQAGVKSAKAEVVIEESISSPVTRSPSMDCSPAMKTIDQPTLLFQSLKRVCCATVSTGLTAKEAVAKIQEQRLPGLIDGGERLIVQVAKAFRSSSAFIEREERGRYFMQESSDLDAWENFQTADSKREEAAVEPKSAETEFETIIEAAKQLQKLQEPINVEPKVGLTTQSGTDHWAQALRSKSTISSRGKVEPPSTPQKASPSSRDQAGPRCNRDDGKGWRCVRMAEAGFSLCKYHRDQIRRAEIRRRKARNKSKKPQHTPASPSGSPVQPAVKPSNPTSKEIAKTVKIAPEKTPSAKTPDSDNEMHDHKRRRFVKAKSLRSLL